MSSKSDMPAPASPGAVYGNQGISEKERRKRFNMITKGKMDLTEAERTGPVNIYKNKRTRFEFKNNNGTVTATAIHNLTSSLTALAGIDSEEAREIVKNDAFKVLTMVQTANISNLKPERRAEAEAEKKESAKELYKQFFKKERLEHARARFSEKHGAKIVTKGDIRELTGALIDLSESSIQEDRETAAHETDAVIKMIKNADYSSLPVEQDRQFSATTKQASLNDLNYRLKGIVLPVTPWQQVQQTVQDLFEHPEKATHADIGPVPNTLALLTGCIKDQDTNKTAPVTEQDRENARSLMQTYLAADIANPQLRRFRDQSAETYMEAYPVLNPSIKQDSVKQKADNFQAEKKQITTDPAVSQTYHATPINKINLS